MSQLHQFQRYSQAENVVTNNTLGLLRQIYRENPKRFERLIASIWDEAGPPELGLTFHQQVRGGESVPDGMLSQESVRIAIETKLDDTFDIDQIRRHCSILEKSSRRYAMLLYAASGDGATARWHPLREELAQRNIHFVALSFATLVEKIRALYSGHHEDMLDLLEDYSAFCDDLGLLPQEEWTVFVPPCGQSFDENISERLYYCSSERSIRPTRYLGIYSERAVRAIGTISRVVTNPLIDPSTGTVSLVDGEPPLSDEERSRIVRACVAADARGWPIDSDHKFYLCDELVETEWRKATPGGIQNRRYLSVKEAPAVLRGNLASLAGHLRQKEWR